MVAEVRQGPSMRSVAREQGVALGTVRWWMERAGNVPLSRVDWSDRAPIPRKIHRTAQATEDLVLSVRRALKEDSDLGEYGARAVHRELLARAHPVVPAVRTIGRILERRGVLDSSRRLRRPPPPRGWYLPHLAHRHAELDSFDIIEGLCLQGGIHIEVLTVTSLHGGLVGAWPQTPVVTAKFVVGALREHWRAFGLPEYVQFDNDTIFQGSHHGRDALGRVTRTCLGLGVTPVFVPPRESSFQAAIENFNGRWQTKVWARFQHAAVADLLGRSERYVSALRRRSTERIDAAPSRRPLPPHWQPDLQAHPHGLLIFIRRTSEHGTASLLGRTFPVDALWQNRLVRCEVNLTAHVIRFFALRRRDPDHQPLLRECPYVLPRKPFHE
jgi:hypothetical protein